MTHSFIIEKRKPWSLSGLRNGLILHLIKTICLNIITLSGSLRSQIHRVNDISPNHQFHSVFVAIFFPMICTCVTDATELPPLSVLRVISEKQQLIYYVSRRWLSRDKGVMPLASVCTYETKLLLDRVARITSFLREKGIRKPYVS